MPGAVELQHQVQPEPRKVRGVSPAQLFVERLCVDVLCEVDKLGDHLNGCAGR